MNELLKELLNELIMITYTLLSAFEEFERLIYVKFDGMSGRHSPEFGLMRI